MGQSEPHIHEKHDEVGLLGGGSGVRHGGERRCTQPGAESHAESGVFSLRSEFGPRRTIASTGDELAQIGS